MNENQISDLMSNLPFDNIILDADDVENDIWSNSSFANLTVDEMLSIPDTNEFLLSGNVLDQNTIAGKEPASTDGLVLTEGFHHDCMLSGTCTSDEHKIKKKYRFSHIDELIAENSEIGDSYNKPPRMEKLVQENQGLPVKPSNRIHQVLDEWDGALTCLTYDPIDDQLPSLATTSALVNCSRFEHPLPPQMSTGPPPLQYFSSLQSFITSDQKELHQLLNTPDKMNMNYEMLPKQGINNIDYNSTAQTESCASLPYEDGTFKLCSPGSSPGIIPYYPPPSMKMGFPYQRAQSPLLFYNNSILTLDQFNQINSGFSQAPPPLYYNLQPVYNATAHEPKPPKVRKYKKSSKLTKALKKKLAKATAFHYSSGEQYFGMNMQEPIIKRNMHNTMERQRRINLKNHYVELKHAIPMLDRYDRVPKISILREATEYCRKLRNDEKEMESELKKLKRMNAKLIRLTH